MTSNQPPQDGENPDPRPQQPEPPQQERPEPQQPEQQAPQPDPQPPQQPQQPVQPQQPQYPQQQQPQEPRPGQQYPQQYEQPQQPQAQQPQAQQRYTGGQPNYYADGQQAGYAQDQQQPQGYDPASQQFGVAPQTPKRRGLPVGGWIGIGAGVLVLALLLIFGGIYAANLVRDSLQATTPTPPATTEAPTDPTEPTETDDPTDLDGNGTDIATGEVVTLQEQLDYAAGPFWQVTVEPDWDFDTLDQGGYNRLSHVDSGCQLLTYQDRGDPNETSQIDEVATENIMQAILQAGLPFDAEGEIDIEPDGSQEILFNFDQPVEMMRLGAEYVTVDGTERERMIMVRTFTPSNSILYAELDCPSSEIAVQAPETFDQLAITDL